MARNGSSHTKSPGWRTSISNIRFENKMMRLREDHLELPTNPGMEYAYIERGPAVVIVPVTREGEIVLIRQFRYPVDDRCLEVPAGTARDTEGMSLQDIAAKELREEIGVTFDCIQRIGSFFSNPSLCDEECHAFIALGVSFVQRPQREPGEEIETVLVPMEEALSLARRCEIKTGPAALALFLAEPHLVRNFTKGR
jgi:ADP-ribose pyrophosphatase